MSIALALLFGLFLAYANGANDNFKGVATLFGSGTADYRHALGWATVTTFGGSLAALFLAQGLLATFSGRGLVPDDVAVLKSFSVAVVLASALTVMLATRLGFPVSTTHALTGALVGAGWLASPAGVDFSKLGGYFLAPLIVSPALAFLCAVAAYPLFRIAREKCGIQKETCLCVGAEPVMVFSHGTSPDRALALYRAERGIRAVPSMSIGVDVECHDRYAGKLLGVNAKSALDLVHYLSAGVVSFARGLNDTPKIAALLLVGGAFTPGATITVVALAISAGGLFNAKKVAHTMAHRVTAMNAGQGFTANLVTGVIVIFASKFGLPVSTTHVSCGALFGIGAATRQAYWKTISGILAAWVITLPVAALLGGGVFRIARGFMN